MTLVLILNSIHQYNFRFPLVICPVATLVIIKILKQGFWNSQWPINQYWSTVDLLPLSSDAQEREQKGG